VELGTQVFKEHLAVAYKMGDVNEARRYLDSFFITSPLPPVMIRQVERKQFRGSWFAASNAEPDATVLYFHGGGYSFYPGSYADFIARIALAANSRLFTLDYRLSPEHRFPAQLEDALNSYRWLLEDGANPDNLIVAGDSAGGNLALALLLAARDAKLPLPALAIALSPATGFELGTSIVSNQAYDWIDRQTLERWTDWFCDSAERRNPLVSPVLADLHGLPPIYVQAGRAEILFDSIHLFANRAREQGVDILFESWEDMNHDFQMFGYDAPQSAEALRRIGEVIHARIRARRDTEAVSRVSL
jgi:epsilon-lactone hydrolase